jgi:hypothetical protein
MSINLEERAREFYGVKKDYPTKGHVLEKSILRLTALLSCVQLEEAKWWETFDVANGWHPHTAEGHYGQCRGSGGCARYHRLAALEKAAHPPKEGE